MVDGEDGVNRHTDLQSNLSLSQVTVDESFWHTGELRGPKNVRESGIS